MTVDDRLRAIYDPNLYDPTHREHFPEIAKNLTEQTKVRYELALTQATIQSLPEPSQVIGALEDWDINTALYYLDELLESKFPPDEFKEIINRVVEKVQNNNIENAISMLSSVEEPWKRILETSNRAIPQEEEPTNQTESNTESVSQF